MSRPADQELVERARRGDERAIGELFSRYWRAARAAAFGVTGEFASAEDAAAEAFREALAGMDSLRDAGRFGAWLRTIVVRKAQRARQGWGPATEALAEELSDPQELPDAALERLELGAMVQQAVRALPDRLREAMALFYFEGYDSETAARFLDVPGGTLRRWLHDGRREVRRSVEQILEGRKRMDGERSGRIERLKALIEGGAIYQGLRESLALRPPPEELTSWLQQRLAPPGGPRDSGGESAEALREMAQQILRPSRRASDPQHPVGAVAAAIRKALPEFQEWTLDAGEAAVRFLTSPGEHRDRLRAALPPGFAEGRPGAFLRATRAILRPGGDGSVQSVYQVLQDSTDEGRFRAALRETRVSDVLDLTWMVTGSLELRSVQELLERVAAVVLPRTPVRFAAYDEPRYRAALQLHVGGAAARGACGGVLRDWPGRPFGADAAHVRVFLEPWAAERSGHEVAFEALPPRPHAGKTS